MSNKLARQHTFTSLLKFSLPTIIMMVFMSLYTMIDGIFVSRLVGTDALSAVNIVYPLISIIIGIGIMLASGASAIVARKMGQGKTDEARQDFTLIVLVGAILGLTLTGIIYVSFDSLLYFLGANEDIYALCREYTFPIMLFITPAIFQMLFQTFFVTAGRPGMGLGVTVLGGIANIVLDYLFIAVYGWGIAGAAIATGIGFSIPALYGLLWFALRRKDTLCFVKPVWRKRVLLDTAVNGSSEMVTNLSTAIITYLFNIMMMRYLGSDGIAALTIVLYAEYLLIAIYLGYSTGIAPVLSYNHGENNIVQLKKLFRISMKFLIGCSLFTFLGAMFGARYVVTVFARKGTNVYDLAVHGFYLYSFCYLFKGINIYGSSMFTALSDGKTSAILSFLRSLVFIILGIVFLPNWLGVDGVWLAVPFAEILSVGCSLYYFRRLFAGKWKYHPINKKKFSPNCS